MLQHQYDKVLEFVAKGPISAKNIQNYIGDTFEVCKGTATLMAAQFITKAYEKGDINIHATMAHITKRSEPLVATLHEQPEPGNG